VWASMRILFYVHNFMHLTQENITHVVKLNSRWNLSFIEIETFPNFTSHVFPFYLFLLKFEGETWFSLKLKHFQISPHMFFLSTSFSLSLMSQLCLLQKRSWVLWTLQSFVDFADISNIIYIGKFLYEESWLIKTRDP
jgi:hypothetical protein